jgi:hypothetical protein
MPRFGNHFLRFPLPKVIIHYIWCNYCMQKWRLAEYKISNSLGAAVYKQLHGFLWLFGQKWKNIEKTWKRCQYLNKANISLHSENICCGVRKIQMLPSILTSGSIRMKKKSSKDHTTNLLCLLLFDIVAVSSVLCSLALHRTSTAQKKYSYQTLLTSMEQINA